MPSVVRLKLRSTIGCALPPVPSRNASSRRVERVEQLRRRVAVGAAVAAEPGHQHPRLVAGDDDVRLERAVPALDDLAPERGDRVVRVELRRARDLPCPRARRAAVRPVERDRLARRAAEELRDRDAERLPLEVEERVLDPADRLLDDRPRALAGAPVEIPVDRLDRARVAADDERREIRHDAGKPGGRAVRVGHLRPADQPVVGRRLDEEPRPPAGVAGERLDRGELHAAGGYALLNPFEAPRPRRSGGSRRPTRPPSSSISRRGYAPQRSPWSGRVHDAATGRDAAPEQVRTIGAVLGEGRATKTARRAGTGARPPTETRAFEGGSAKRSHVPDSPARTRVPSPHVTVSGAPGTEGARRSLAGGSRIRVGGDHTRRR